MNKKHAFASSRLVILLTLAALLFSLAPVHLAAESGSGIAALPPRPDLASSGRLQPVPDEIRELFAEGIPVEEFVALTGRVPRALVGMVDREVAVIIELEERPIAAIYAERQALDGPVALADLEPYGRSLAAAQDAVMAQAGSLGAREISRYTAVYNGIQVRVPASRIAELAALPGVKAVHRAPVHQPALGASVPLIGAPEVWNNLGYDGEGIVIAVIDTGIDYTHAALGGSGDPNDYAANDPDFVEAGTFPTAKVIDGWDFAGTLYDADCSPADEMLGICSATPSPDPDPLDEHGHGTHVASIAAGIQAGSVMTGTAPAAQLVALKVFGADGTTTLTIDALEWAVTNYIAEGWPHVINMSLGSIFGTDDPNDPSVWASNLAASVGIVVVASAGNEGNENYITGSPGTASKVLSVAATTTGYMTGPTVNVLGAAPITQTNIIYTPSAFDGNTGRFDSAIQATLRYAGSLPGAADNLLCTTTGITPGALTGEVALISRGTCPFSQKVNNAAALGAVAALIYNNAAGTITMAGDPVTIPAGSLRQQDGLNLIPASGQTVAISAQSDVMSLPDPSTPPDSIGSFSSTGPRGYDSALKPEVAAPGVSIFAADAGTGTAGVAMSGTSMAAPHVAGVAALLRQARPGWTPEEIKAAIMNTAIELPLGVQSIRSGNGRVDAYAAVNTGVVAIGDDDLVSLNWGVVTSKEDTVVLTGTVTLHNKSAAPASYDTSIALQSVSPAQGVTSLSVAPSTVVVGGDASAQVTVTIELDMSEVNAGYAQTLEAYTGRVVLTPSGAIPGSQAGPVPLTVPFLFVPKPYVSLEVQADRATLNPLADTATITLTHTGPVGSDLWAYPALYASSSPRLDMLGMGNIRMFGMDFIDSVPGYGDLIGVAINTWGPWHVPQPYFAEFDLRIDADQNGTWDYVNFNFNLGWWSGSSDNNTWIVVQLDVAAGRLFLGSPYVIYTDYANALMEWYLPAAWNDLGPGASTFDYWLIGFDPYGVADPTPPGTLDYINPALWWSWPGNPSPGNPVRTMTVQLGEQSMYELANPAGLMIVDFAGDPANADGAQAYLVPFRAFWMLQLLPITRDDG